MIDIHSHIIPNVDDGSDGVMTSLKLLQRATIAGTTKIVATPHYCMGYAEVPYNEILQKVKELNKLAKEENIDIKVYSGQEVYYNDEIVNNYREGLIGTINNSHYMLIEFSMAEFDEGLFNTLYELQLLGIKVIIAHPERYMPIINDPAYINKFIDEGFLFQMNSGSLTGHFGKSIQKTCEILLENDIYSFIGSDAHNLRGRDTNMKAAICILEEKYEQYIDIFNENGNRLLRDEEILFLGNKINKKKKKFGFSLFKKC